MARQPDPDAAVPFSEVKKIEIDEIGSPEDQLLGLAFSGGGIRSATFNLGILQALAQLRLLHCFDYLSTVSGGREQDLKSAKAGVTGGIIQVRRGQNKV